MLGLPPCGKKTEIGTLRWVALGDSLTFGYGATPEQSYPERIMALSKESPVKMQLVKNLANGGHTLAKVQLLQLTRLGFYKPDVVSLWVGINDAILNAALGKTFDLASREKLPTSFENFQRRFEEVLTKLSKMNLKHVFVGTLHDLSKVPVALDWDETKTQSIKKIVDGYNEVFIRVVSIYPNVTLVPLDQVGALQEPSLYMQDGLHPKPQAYQPVAEAWWEIMKKKL